MSGAPSLGRLVDNVGALLFRQLATWLLASLLVLFLPRYLGDTGLGKITFALALTTVLGVLANLGTDTFIIKEVAKDRSRLPVLFWNAAALRLALGLIALTLVSALAHAFVGDGELRLVLIVYGANLVVMSLNRALEASFQGLERMRWISIAEVLNKATVTGLGVFALASGAGVVVFAAIVLLGSGVGLAVNAAFLATTLSGRPRFSLRLCIVMVAGGLPFLFVGAITQLYQWSGVWLLRVLTADDVVGWYGAAIQLFAALNVIPLVLSTALLPRLSLAFATDPAGARRLASISLAVVLSTGLPLSLGLCVLSRDLIRLLDYPATFDNSIPLVAILAVNLSLTGVLMLISTTLIAMDRQRAWLRLIAASLALNLALHAALIPVFDSAVGNGGIGAAAAAVTAEVFQLAVGLRLLPAGIVGRETGLAFARSGAASLAMLTIIVLMMPLEPWLPLQVAGAGSVYLTALAALGGVRPAMALEVFRLWAQTRPAGGRIEDAVPAAGRID
jgi:O-antigen/teichoic acid export membrane protein